MAASRSATNQALFHTKNASDPRSEELQNYPVDDHHAATTPMGVYAVDMDMRHRPAVNLVLRGREHEPQVVRFIQNRCGNGDVIQAGAFFGDMLPGISAGLRDGSIVWSFEPNARNHYLATKTIQMNRLENVRLINAGLGECSRNAELVTRSEDGTNLGGLSHISGAGNRKETSIGATEDVRLVAIDEIVPKERHVSVIQLDVEGFELEALAGARETIRRCKPVLILEFVETASKVNEVLPGMGYQAVGRLHNRNTVFVTLA